MKIKIHLFVSTAIVCAALAAHAQSPKRGIAYDIAAQADMAALSPGVSWWYNWGTAPNPGVPANYLAQYNMDYYPMLWNGNFNAASVVAFLKANPQIHYLLVLNEPNNTGQSNVTPQQAAAIWPQYEAVAAQAGVKIVGPQMSYGTMANYQNPVTWLDAFIAAYQAANNGRSPQIDYLGFHWYDYGIDAQLNALDKYNKLIWVTEFANWHSQNDGAQITTLAEQEAQMSTLVPDLESRTDVFRYAWFTGRVSPDPHYDSLLAGSGQLTALGQLYVSIASIAGTHHLINKASGLALGGSSNAAGTVVGQYSYGGASNDNWVLSQNSDNSYTLTNVASRLVLDDYGWGSGNGAEVDQWSSNGGTNQHWLMIPNADGTYTIKGVSSGLVLDDPSSSNAPGAAIKLWTSNGGPNQKWLLD